MIRNHVGGTFSNSEALEKFFYYPETYVPDHGSAHWTPTVWFNGLDEQTGAWSNVNYSRSVYTGKIQTMQFFPTPLAMDLQVDFGVKADTGMVCVEIVATDVVAFSDLHLRLAVIESGVSYGTKTYNQILRDFLPDQNGISFSIAQGDTFHHSEPFVIDSGWDATECDVVAFVQNDAERMVIQAVQAPVVISTAVVTETPTSGMPDRYVLSQNYPNPFNPATEIQYTIPADERVSLKVYNIRGAEVAILVESEQTSGAYSVRWDAREMASGVYFCRLQAGEVGRTIKMVLMR